MLDWPASEAWAAEMESGTWPTKRIFFFVGGFGDCEIGSRFQARLHFDEVDAFGFQFADGGIGFGGGNDDDRRLEVRRVAVEVGAGEKDLWAGLVASVDFLF